LNVGNDNKNRTAMRKQEALARKVFSDSKAVLARAEAALNTAHDVVQAAENNVFPARELFSFANETLQNTKMQFEESTTTHENAKEAFNLARTHHEFIVTEVSSAEELLPSNVTHIIEEKFVYYMSSLSNTFEGSSWLGSALNNVVGSIKSSVPQLIGSVEQAIYKFLESSFGYDLPKQAVNRYVEALDARQKAVSDLSHKRDALSTALFQMDSLEQQVGEAEMTSLSVHVDLLAKEAVLENDLLGT